MYTEKWPIFVELLKLLHKNPNWNWTVRLRTFAWFCMLMPDIYRAPAEEQISLESLLCIDWIVPKITGGWCKTRRHKANQSESMWYKFRWHLSHEKCSHQFAAPTTCIIPANPFHNCAGYLSLSSDKITVDITAHLFVAIEKPTCQWRRPTWIFKVEHTFERHLWNGGSPTTVSTNA